LAVASLDDAEDAALRNETPTQRLDRNWAELLQELRIVQTGVQLLTGFLLTLPFQQRFESLTTGERILYLVAVSASLLAIGLLLAPVSLHRSLFRQHRRAETVHLAHRLAIAGIAALAVAIIAVASLIFAVVVGIAASVIATTATALMLGTLWLALPIITRKRSLSDEATR
jgi:Family of unknown function (DUF6328)